MAHIGAMQSIPSTIMFPTYSLDKSIDKEKEERFYELFCYSTI